MHSSNSRTSISSKTIPATPRVGKSTRGPARSDSSSSSPAQASRLSIDRSPKSVDSKPATDRRLRRLSTPPDKQPRIQKATELQPQLAALQEDFDKIKERLVSTEQEKDSILVELKEAKKNATEANERLTEALLANKRAEDKCELEKFRADELEQASIEAAQKNEEKWQKELGSLQSQHALDVAALQSVNQELERVRCELAKVSDARNTALSHADDAVKIAEMNAQKVEVLSSELERVKSLLNLEVQAKSSEASNLMKKLNMEIDSLKQELVQAKAVEGKVRKMEETIAKLENDLDKANKDKSAAGNLLDEWKKKVAALEVHIDEAVQSEKSVSYSLESTLKQLEANNELLQTKESEITSLMAVVESLKMSANKHKDEAEETSRLLQTVQQEAAENSKVIDTLRSELDCTKEEKIRALNDEMSALSRVQLLLEEKSKIMHALEISRDDEEKNKKAMESLASALHEVSSEARETKEKLLIAEAEFQIAKRQLEDTKLSLKESEQQEVQHQTMISEAKEESDSLRKLLEVTQFKVTEMKAKVGEKELQLDDALRQSEEEISAVRKEMGKLVEAAKMEWEQKEFDFLNSIKDSEEKISSIRSEVDRLHGLLEASKATEQASQEDKVRLLSSLKQVESEACTTRAAVEKAFSEISRQKESLLDKENELQTLLQENEELRIREDLALERVKELSILLEGTMTKKSLENEKLSSKENGNNLLTKSEELEKESMGEEEMERLNSAFTFPQAAVSNERNIAAEAIEPKKKMEEAFPKSVSDNGLSHEKTMPLEPDPEHESLDDELGSKNDGDSFDQVNGFSLESLESGAITPDKHQQKKKKRALLRTFGSLLKKKNSFK